MSESAEIGRKGRAAPRAERGAAQIQRNAFASRPLRAPAELAVASRSCRRKQVPRLCKASPPGSERLSGGRRHLGFTRGGGVDAATRSIPRPITGILQTCVCLPTSWEADCGLDRSAT